MKLLKQTSIRLATLCAVLGLMATLVGSACAYSEMSTESAPQSTNSDPRKNTTIQITTADVNGTKSAVSVRYLDFPWGEATFGYFEKGGNDYYSNRTWPFAHMTLAKAAEFHGKALPAGDYVLFITPKTGEKEMMLTLAAFSPNDKGTFLIPGNVFTETPSDAREVVSIPAHFEKGEPVAPHMMIKVEPENDGAMMTVHYGNRWLKEKVVMK